LAATRRLKTRPVPQVNPAILITSSDVVLDLQGHVLDASNDEYPTIKVGYAGTEVSNVIIQNGTIKGFGSVIDLNTTLNLPTPTTP
jgi:hypothetical protein